MTTQPIPVVPAQHYTCGGVVVDLDGRTDLPGLYAAGECTQSGLHGANRLASNSLLECFVFGQAAAGHISRLGRTAASRRRSARGTRAAWPIRTRRSSSSTTGARSAASCGTFVGIVRTTKRLERAQHRIALLRKEIADYYGNFRVTPDLIELRNLVEVADLIVRSALPRKESRGLHYTLDYPETLAEAKDTVLTP